jgi:hypothetical protein
MPTMPKIEFCLPTSGKAVPSGPDWIHEVTYDRAGQKGKAETDDVGNRRLSTICRAVIAAAPAP